jgi:hypothetical protein
VPPSLILVKGMAEVVVPGSDVRSPAAASSDAASSDTVPAAWLGYFMTLVAFGSFIVVMTVMPLGAVASEPSVAG